MELVVPSPDCFPSPRLHFASISAKSASALEEAFGQDFDVSDHLGVQLVKDKEEESGERLRGVSEGAESIVSQPEVPSLALSVAAKQLPSPVAVEEGQVESLRPATLKTRLAEALREIERLQAALEEANQQQEWVLGNVVKNSEAEKEELTKALQEMTAARDALEQELKHNEKEFASLVTEELEQRFAHFEDVTLAAFSKISPTNSAMPGPLPLPYRTPTGPARIAPPAVAEGRVLGAPLARSSVLTAHLGTVGPNMTLVEALQSRQATTALRAMESARDAAHPPLDLCLQARARCGVECNEVRGRSYATVGARLSRSFFGRAFGCGAGAIRAGGQKSLRAIKATPSVLNASAIAVGNAVQHGAAAAGSRARTGAMGVAGAVKGGASWVQHNFTVSNAKHAINQVPAIASKPFVLVGRANKHLSDFFHRKDVLNVLEMYWGISAASLVMLCTLLMGVACIDCVQLMRPSIRYQHNPAAFCNIQELAEQVQAVKQKTSSLKEETRKYDEALAAAMDETLRASKESLSSVLDAKRAMHDRVTAAERRAIRAQHDAKQARAAAAAAAATAAAGSAVGGSAAADGSEPAKDEPAAGGGGAAAAANDDNVWRMDPEELFSWSGFPDIDLRSVVDKLRSRRCCGSFRSPRA